MTKEELLKRLQEMALSLKSDKATEVTAESRRAELKEIEEKRELLNFQIRVYPHTLFSNLLPL